jgi:procollagen-lysine,2-oxoglutarate 5-dioxygenase
MKLFTYGDKPNQIRWLKQPYINVGHGQIYQDTFSKFEALRTAEFVDDDIICFVDGYDVVQYGTLEELEEKFRSFGADLVMSAETFCWPNPWMKHLFPETETKYRFPNCGMYIGYGWAIRKLLEWDTYRINFDDQGYTHDFLLRQNVCRVVLDHDCVMFQNCVFVPLNDFSYFQDRVINNMKGTKPCFFHFSGGSFKTIDGKNIMDLMSQKVPFETIKQNSVRLIQGQ